VRDDLYVFIDESGNPSRSRYFTVAACWCVSSRDNIKQILQPTVGKLKNTANSHAEQSDGISELKGSKLHPEVTHAVASSLGDIEYGDQTLRTQNLPWQIAQPIRFSVHTTNPEIGVDILKEFIGNADSSILAMKTLSLVSVLNPIFKAGLVKTSSINNINVVLDDDPWTNPSKQMENTIDQVGTSLPEIEFSTPSSEAAPGLQIADIAAYSWAKHKRDGGYGTVIGKIEELRFVKE